MQALANHVRRGRNVPSEPRVSVIMPAFNVTPYIAEAIESILAQTFTDYEIVVINDGTRDTDELESALAPYLDRIVYARQENRGVAGARNTGLRLARGEMIAQLDPDDAWLPNFLEVQLRILESRPDLDILYANSFSFGDDRNKGKETMELAPSNGEVTFVRLLSQECTVLSTLVGKKETFQRAGLFDERLRASEDFDMWLRMLKSGVRIGYHRQVLARYRRRSDSMTSNEILMSESILQVLTKTEQTFELTPLERETLTRSKLKWQAFLHLSVGKKALFEGRVETALQRFKLANEYYNSTKISRLIWLLRVSPSTVLQFHLFRKRYVSVIRQIFQRS